jgi:hypothetical protein
VIARAISASRRYWLPHRAPAHRRDPSAAAPLDLAWTATIASWREPSPRREPLLRPCATTGRY